MAKAQSTNMQTGEEAVPPQELWEAVIDKVELSEQQSADLCSVYLLYSSILQQTTEEFGRLAVALSQLIDKDIVRGNVLAYKSSTNICPQMAAAAEEKEHVFKKLEACSRQGSLLHTMLSFLVLSLLEPKQRAVMIFNAFPSFPNLKLILATVYRRASQRTPGIPGMSSP